MYERMYVCNTKYTKYIQNINEYCQCFPQAGTFQKRNVVLHSTISVCLRLAALIYVQHAKSLQNKISKNN